MYLLGRVLFDDGVDFALAHNDQLFAIDFDGVAAGVLAKYDLVANLDGQGAGFAAVQRLAFANRNNFTLVGLFLGGTGQDDATGVLGSPARISRPGRAIFWHSV